MLTYRAAYRRDMGMFFVEVVGFPEATAFGASLTDARGNLAATLRFAAERLLRRGEALPIPDPYAAAPGDAYLVENVTVVPVGPNAVAVSPG